MNEQGSLNGWTAAQFTQRVPWMPARNATPDAVYTIERLKLSRRWAVRRDMAPLATTEVAEDATFAVLVDTLEATPDGRATARRSASALAEELRGIDVWRRTRQEVRVWVEGR